MSNLYNFGEVAKMVLKVKFLGKFSVSIDLVTINKKYVKKPGTNDFMYYESETNDFVIWSTQDFLFDNRQIRLPDELNLSDPMSHIHVFGSDTERYSTLKKMYSTLETWSKVDDMKRGVFVGKKKKVVLAGDFWYIS